MFKLRTERSTKKKPPKFSGFFISKSVGVAVLHSTRFDNSKGTRIGPSLFYASELHSKYNNKSTNNFV